MVTTIRAGISVLMLAGFYVFALGLLGALAAASLWLWREHPGGAALKVSLLAAAVVGGLVVALWKVARARPEQPSGLVLTPAAAPVLWATVGELATAVQTRVPDEIRLVPEVNAAVAEDAKLLGLLPGRRTMYIGVPLVQAFTVAQLRSVLAHELGHYSHSHTRIGALAHRGRMMIVGTIAHTRSGLVGWLFRQYAKLYLLVEQAVSRRLEYEADQASLRVAGRGPATSALRELPVLSAAWGFYFENYVTIGWERGYAPAEVLGGFRCLLDGRAGELAKLRGTAAPEASSRWDSHPPIADRIAAIEARPDPGVPDDPRPAAVLFPDLDEQVRRLEAEVVDTDGRTVLPWDELVATALAAETQPRADALFRAAARLAGRDRGDLPLVLDLLAAGAGPELAAAVAPHAAPADAMDALAGYVDSAFDAALVASGVARWRLSWSGPAQLVDSAGAQVNLAPLVPLALNPTTVGEARDRLLAAGVDLDAARQLAERSDAVGAEVLGGLANMKSNGASFDVFILDAGLLLVPAPKSSDKGKNRMIEILRSAPVAELARRYRLVAFEEIASAEILKAVPVRVNVVLRGGERIPLHQGWTGEQLAKGSDELLRAALDPFVAEPAAGRSA